MSYMSDDIGFEPDSIWGQAHAQGGAKIVLRQLRARFGALNPQTQARVESAQAERLELWAERLLTAQTLDEVFSE